MVETTKLPGRASVKMAHGTVRTVRGEQVSAVRSTISRAMARPRPVPSALVVKNGSNGWTRRFGTQAWSGVCAGPQQTRLASRVAPGLRWRVPSL